MNSNKKVIALFLSLSLGGLPLAGPPLTAEETTNISSAVIDRLLTNPLQAYSGEMVISYWSGTNSRAEEVKIYFLPPNKYRFEFMAPNGTIDRIVLTDNTREEIRFLKNGRVVETRINRTGNSQLRPEDEKDLLLTNYQANIQNAAPMLGRPMLAVELTPIISGKPFQTMKIDQATQVILEIKRYTVQGETGSLVKFTQFEPTSSLSRDLFISDSPLAGRNSEADVQYASLDMEMPGDDATHLPSKLYGGFSLQNASQFDVTGKLVNHLRYSDGLIQVSLFRTPLPVKISADKQAIEWNDPLRMGSPRASRVYNWEKNREHFTLIGDVQQDLLKEIAHTLQ